MATPSLTLLFENKLSKQEITMFRGAINAIIPDRSILFHNHQNETLRYSYPLIQYKALDGHAAIVCVADGVDVIGSLLQVERPEITIGNRRTTLSLMNILPAETEIGVDGEQHTFTLRDWLPLNGDNYLRYSETQSLAERIQLLERILVGNILSFCKGIGVTITDTIQCSINDIMNTRLIRRKGVQMMAFDIRFTTNVNLPANIGLGKDVSTGCGTLLKN